MLSHIEFDPELGVLRLLDQRELPHNEKYLQCSTYRDVVDAIRTLAVRGAPALGVAGAWATVLAALEARNVRGKAAFLDHAMQEIRNARPTAVNLMWAVERMAIAFRAGDSDLESLMREAEAIQNEDLERCRRIGEIGSSLISDGDTVLTHCNAGSLATAGYGTALGVIRAACAEGKNVKVIADETRPLLQGSRLTAYELVNEGIPVEIAPDNACAAIMARGLAQLVITGADRIAANGDSANKIGTLGVAILARYFGIPFYIAAPLSTIDPDAADASDIPIESRDANEVLCFNGARIAPEQAGAVNFAFDVTPADLITGIVTEVGILYPPYSSSIADALRFS